MRQFKILVLILAVMIAAGCKKEKKKSLDITGTWELMDIQTKAAQIGDATVEVLITFNSDNTFSIRQMLGQGRPVEYTGTWQLTETVLTGKYSDGKSWGASYNISLEAETLIMTPDKPSAETYVYHKK